MDKTTRKEEISCLEEYKLLKTEEISHFQRKETINMFGWTSIGALIGITFLNFQYHQRVVFFLLFAIPVLCFIVLIHWLSNISRIMKLGSYLSSLEKQNKNVANYFKWETFLETNKKIRHEHSEYIASLCLYLGICLSSLVFRNAVVIRDKLNKKECYYLYEVFLDWFNIKDYKVFFFLWSVILFGTIFSIVLNKCIKILSMDGKILFKNIIHFNHSRLPSGRTARMKKSK